MTYSYDITRTAVSEETYILLDSKSVANYAKTFMYQPNTWRESAWAIFADRQGRALGHFRLSEGTIRCCNIDIKPLACAALRAMADMVILVHNHPSGDSKPSPADIKQTGLVKSALDVVDISLADHVIIGEGEYYSFSDEKKGKL